jgi:hypothetical protein
MVLSRTAGQAQQSDQALGDGASAQDSGAAAAPQLAHGADHHQRQPLGLVEAQALGQQVGQHDEQRGDAGERQPEAHRLGLLRPQPGLDQAGEMRAQRALAHHTGQDGQRVHADLHDGEVMPGASCTASTRRTRVAAIGQLLQLETARRGQRQLGHRRRRHWHR